MSQPAADLLAATVRDGGGTFESGTLLPFTPDHGFAVGMGGVSTPATMATIGWFAQVTRRVTEEWGESFIGTWYNHEDERVYVDAVRYVADDLAYALDLARQTRQLAIYDFGSKSTIDVEQGPADLGGES